MKIKETKTIINEALGEYPVMLTASEVKQALAISDRTFYSLQAAGELPDCVQIGKQKRWLKVTLVEYLAKCWKRASPLATARKKGKKGASARYGEPEISFGPKTKGQLREERIAGGGRA